MNSFKSIKHAMIAILVTSAFPVSATTYYYNSGTLSVTPFSTVESFTTNLPANGNYTISFTSASGAGSLNFAGDTKSWNSSQASSGYSASSMDISGSITSSFTSYYSSSFTITGLCISSAGSCSSSSSSSSSSSTAETTTKSQVKKAAVAQSRSIRKMVAQSRNRFIDSKKELQTAMLVADGSTGNGFLTQGQFEKLFGVGDGWNRFVQGDFELSHEEGQGNAGYC